MSNGDRVPIGAFKEDVDGLGRDTRFLTAHYARNRFRRAVVRDHHHALVKDIGLLVQRQQLLAALGPMHAQIALHLVGIKDVQGPVPVEGEKVGDVHQR